MIVQQNISTPIKVTYQLETSNKSFVDMYCYLRDKGIKNNKFFLVLYDRDLAGVDPRDPRLNEIMKMKILRECKINFWYFIREVVRIPDQGGSVGGGVRYKLHRGNLALNYGFILNWNMFLELPRQFGKTISAICWYLWVYNFGTTNSELMFMNKKHDDSKLNLARLKDIRESLPRYLRLNIVQGKNGEVQKLPENVETMKNYYTNNKITTKPGARNKANANSIGRGCTMPIHWYDEFAFILHNKIIYLSATPAFSTASKNAQRNGAPFGILITTTPGDMTTDEGTEAFKMKEGAIPFHEEYYDFDAKKLAELRATNTDSSFFYMRFTYTQLGAGEEYFKKMCIDMNKDWPAIRREVLLEWSTSSDNSPFTKQDLDIVKGLIKEPLYQIPLANFYFLDVYKPIAERSHRYPPLVGVDVSGGYNKDASAITIVDSKTTETVACFNCNYISTVDLARVLYELVTKYIPTAIVNIERNGGFGASVLSQLIKTKVKRNLYYEIKDRVFEERSNGVTTVKQTKRVKVYGFDETKSSRELLMGILRERMENHKAKFISPIIYNELCTLEVKKNGRIEHSTNGHDDQIFSYLLALYIWYEGKDLMERFGLEKSVLYTDDDNTIELGIEEQGVDISQGMSLGGSKLDEELDNFFKDSKSMSYSQWRENEINTDQEILNKLIKTDKRARHAWMAKNFVDLDDSDFESGMTELPMEVFNDYLTDSNQDTRSQLQKQFDSITNLR